MSSLFWYYLDITLLLRLHETVFFPACNICASHLKVDFFKFSLDHQYGFEVFFYTNVCFVLFEEDVPGSPLTPALSPMPD